MKRSAVLANFMAILLAAVPALAQHPRPQPYPLNPNTGKPGSEQTMTKDSAGVPLWTVEAWPANFLERQNFLLTVDSNMFTAKGIEMLNTEPSRPGVPFNLHDGNPVVTSIDPTSPTDDLSAIISKVTAAAGNGTIDRDSLSFGVDILEGNPIPTRPTYSGFPLLHYTGPEKVKRVVPQLDENGKVVGGNVDIHQIWFDINIESDTAFLDPSAVQDVPWTITYTIDVLHRGADDFAPYVMYFDDPPLDANGRETPGGFGLPHVGMDATFFPMNEGGRYMIKIKMAPAKYFNLIYTWGWRMHPPRIQVVENALKSVNNKNIVQWEQETFGPAPRSSEQAKLAAIAKIGELAPAKRMWQAFKQALQAGSSQQVRQLMNGASLAFADWSDRTRLPQGVTADPDSDVTLFYVNNTIYANDGILNLPKWNIRPGTFKATLLNGDHFVHGYMDVDFGGARGWENQFQSGYDDDPLKALSTGCTFTFGRTHWWINAGGPWGYIDIDPVNAQGVPGKAKVQIKLNFEPSKRLRLYNFDPYHHDVAIYSLH